MKMDYWIQKCVRVKARYWLTVRIYRFFFFYIRKKEKETEAKKIRAVLIPSDWFTSSSSFPFVIHKTQCIWKLFTCREEMILKKVYNSMENISTFSFGFLWQTDTPLRINNGCQREEEGKKLLSQSQGSFFWPVTQTWERRKKISNVISHWGAKGRKHFLTWFLKGLWPLSLLYQGIFHCVQKALNIFSSPPREMERQMYWKLSHLALNTDFAASNPWGERNAINQKQSQLRVNARACGFRGYLLSNH